jgi:hypothetical protein
VEDLTEEMGTMGRQYVSARVPDTTLWDLFAGQRRRRPRKGAATNASGSESEIIHRPLHAEDFRRQLRLQVRSMWRGKCLAPRELPCGVVAIDGKGLGALEHDAEGLAQKGHRSDGSPYWLARVLRASLISAPSCPALDQVPIGSKTNEVASFIAFFDEVQSAYGSMFEVVSVDAGMTSKANADHVHAANKGYVMALKDNQPELLAEAKRLMRPLMRKEPCAMSTERYRGETVTRRLYRTSEIEGYHGWEHLRQVWLVAQDRERPSGVITSEHRFFLTNLHRGRLSAVQVLAVIRRHWGVENDCFWSFDVQWNEDALPWCTVGGATEVLGLLRMMAYNLVQLARNRSLRRRTPDGVLSPPPAWRSLFRWVRQALHLSLEPEQVLLLS